ncbi:MAG: hypothetical protein A2W29_04810 [Gemmatimonadetes bacterium RBG_16_66_8]|nr:MAG: hypothetical protein A2W29_04810 [Gemmatimonadetes bacterium RBG_16_66_8]
MLVSIPSPLARVIAIGAELGAALQRKAAVLNRERVIEMTQPRWVCDASATFRDLNFTPSHPTSVGVAETAEWYRKAGWM